MSSATLGRDAFAPRPPRGMGPGLVLALIAHALLILALAWSVNWHASEPEGVVAELWSALPQTAAPRVAPPEPVAAKPEPPPPKPEPPPPPKPEPPAPRPAVVEPARPDPQIAIEKAAREKATREKAALEKAAVEKAQREEARKAELAREREREAAREREQERQRVAAEREREKKRLEAERERQEEARLAAAREANLRRARAQAGGSDDPSAAGTAVRTSGPSAGYAGRIKARIKPNIVLTGNVNGNPLAAVEVRLAPDGTIVGRKLVKSSGSPVWDETVLRAIDKTEVLPKDVDGRVPASMTIEFKPQE